MFYIQSTDSVIGYIPSRLVTTLPKSLVALLVSLFLVPSALEITVSLIWFVLLRATVDQTSPPSKLNLATRYHAVTGKYRRLFDRRLCDLARILLCFFAFAFWDASLG